MNPGEVWELGWREESKKEDTELTILSTTVQPTELSPPSLPQNPSIFQMPSMGAQLVPKGNIHGRSILQAQVLENKGESGAGGMAQ